MARHSVGADGMSQNELVQTAARRYAEEDIEAKPLHILDPGNELLQDLVNDFQKHIWPKMTLKQTENCYTQGKSSIDERFTLAMPNSVQDFHDSGLWDLGLSRPARCQPQHSHY